MKVIHILNELKFSGAEIMYVDAAKSFQEKGCELYVLATSDKEGEYAPYFAKAGYKVLHKRYPALANYIGRIFYYRWFIKLLKQEQIDVVHIHANRTMWGMALCAWLANTPSVYTFHSVFTPRFYSYIYRYCLRWSAKHIFKCRFQTISDSVYDNELKKWYNPTTKIYNWYGCNRFFPANEFEKQKFRQELKISPETLVLISVGGCSHVKRHTDIIKAMPEIMKQIPNCLYLHLGKGTDEAAEMDLAKELDIENNIRFCGNQTDVRKYLIASDIYLMPSKYEGIPITAIEVMACKVPVILYNVPGLRDFNKEKECAVLIEEDYRKLAESVILLHKNPNKQKELTTNGKKFVDTHFDVAKNSARIFELYFFRNSKMPQPQE